jgi:hypothetical protein
MNLEIRSIMCITFLIGSAFAANTGTTIVQGNVANMIVLNPPDNVPLDLSNAPNSETHSELKVSANGPWYVNVRPDTDGRMKEWSNGNYVPGGKALYYWMRMRYYPSSGGFIDKIMENRPDITLIPVQGAVIDGKYHISFIQTLRAGVDQRVYPNKYHIVITFTGSLQF